MAAVRYPEFSIIWFWAMVALGFDFPSLYQIWCKNVDQHWNYGRKSKSKMAAVRHLEFVTSSYRTAHEVYSLGHIGLSNFLLIRCTVFQLWRFEFFADLAWNAYSRPQNFGLSGSKALNVIGHHRDPQKAHPWPEPRLHGDFGGDRSSGVTWARDEEREKETYSANWVFVQTTHVDAAICGLACHVGFGR